MALVYFSCLSMDIFRFSQSENQSGTAFVSGVLKALIFLSKAKVIRLQLHSRFSITCIWLKICYMLQVICIYTL